MGENKIFDLDTSAKIYPYAATKTWTQNYRMSMRLTQDVKPDILKQAAKNCHDRFPTMYAVITDTPSWYRLQETDSSDIIFPDGGEICAHFDIKDKSRPLIRVIYTDRTVSAEFFHSISDGYGAVVFLKTLLGEYYRLQGINIPCEKGVLNPQDKPTRTETMDAFPALYKKGDKKVGRSETVAYQLDTDIDKSKLEPYRICFTVDSVKKKSKEYSTTINSYLVSVYLYAFYLNRGKRDDKKPIKISVPLNMRKYFPYDTLRNFSLYHNVSIDPNKELSLADIIKSVDSSMKEGLDPERLRLMASTNVADAKNPLADIAPNFLKKPLLKASYHIFGDRFFTSPFSNLGIIDMPDELKAHVEGFASNIGVTPNNNIYCVASSYGNMFTVSLLQRSAVASIPKLYTEILRTEGIDAQLLGRL